MLTPEKVILKGITRKHTLEIAKDVCEIGLWDIMIEEVKNAKEVFINSSSKRITAVVQIDDYKIGNGKPGVLTLQLSKLLETHILELLAKSVPI